MTGNAPTTRAAADAFHEAAGDGSWPAALNGLAHLTAGEHREAETALMTSELDAPMQRAIMARLQKELGREAEAHIYKNAVMADNQFGLFNLGFAFARLSLQ